jgi:uncharacterized membrane protein (GlpM family)
MTLALLLKSLLGALAVVLISLLSRSRNYYIAGLVPLFPTFALIAHYIVGSERGALALKTTVLFGMWSLLPYFIYLFSLYCLLDRLRLPWALAAATLSWGVAAFVLILGWSRWHG